MAPEGWTLPVPRRATSVQVVFRCVARRQDSRIVSLFEACRVPLLAGRIVVRPNSDTRQTRRVSAAEAAAVVRSGDWVDYFTTLAQPDAFDRALAARKEELRGVKFRSCISLRPRAVVEADPTGEHFAWFSWHFSAYDRRKHDAGLAHYMPTNLSELSDYYRRFIPPPDVAVLQARPMDAGGWFNQSG